MLLIGHFYGLRVTRPSWPPVSQHEQPVTGFVVKSIGITQRKRHDPFPSNCDVDLSFGRRGDGAGPPTNFGTVGPASGTRRSSGSACPPPSTDSRSQLAGLCES